MPRGYWQIWTATLLFFAAFYSLLVPLPLYLEGLRFPDWQIAFVLGAFGVAALLGRPLSGVAADAWGYNRIMVLGAASLLVGAVGTSVTHSLTLLTLLRVLQAFGYVAFTTAATARVSELLPAERRAHGLAWFGTSANVAMTCAPALVSLAIPVIALRGAFWLAGGLAVVAGLLAQIGRHTATAPPTGVNVRDLLVIRRDLWRPVCLAAAFGAGFGVFLQFLPLLAELRSVDSGLIYTVYGITIIASRLLVGRWLDTLRPALTLSVGFVALGGGLVSFAMWSSMTGLLAGAICLAAAGAIVHPLLISIHVGQSEDRMAHGSAVFYLGFDLGMGAGTWFVSPIFESGGLPAAYLVSVVYAVAGLALALRFRVHPPGDR